MTLRDLVSTCHNIGQIGDTIICSSQDDMIDTMMELAQTGIETDFVYGDEDKYKLVVTDIEEGEEQ
jgi:hypothetical protein